MAGSCIEMNIERRNDVDLIHDTDWIHKSSHRGNNRYYCRGAYYTLIWLLYWSSSHDHQNVPYILVLRYQWQQMFFFKSVHIGHSVYRIDMVNILKLLEHDNLDISHPLIFDFNVNQYVTRSHYPDLGKTSIKSLTRDICNLLKNNECLISNWRELNTRVTLRCVFVCLPEDRFDQFYLG